MELSFEEKYNAIGKEGQAYEGIFITAVVTTGIFCRPSCRARKPKAENVIFYNNSHEAIQHGFRPCKICRPMEVGEDTPDYIKELIKELHENPYLKIKDQDLKNRGIEPNQIRRWFKTHHHMTFQAYQRMLRINTAYKLMKKGHSVTDTAFDVGYESLSGFNESYKNVFGQAPSKSQTQKVVNIVRFTSQLGPMFACATEDGLCLLEFTDRKMLEAEFQDIGKRLQAIILPGKNPHLNQVQTELEEYFEGIRKEFTVPLDMVGTEFQTVVWKQLLEIPYGVTWSYKQMAERLKNPKAVRAVGTANGMNKIAIIIPCHRVIGSNGDLTGYGGGLARKKWLLDLEKRNSGQGQGAQKISTQNSESIFFFLL